MSLWCFRSTSDRGSSVSIGRAGLPIAVSLYALSLALPAQAQTAAQTADAASDKSIEEIVVTGNRRSERDKDVPISISVLSGTQLTDQHILGYEDLSRRVPGVSFAAQGQPGLDNISIRGVSSGVGSQTVGIYLDDVPLLITNNYEGAAQPKFLDLANVEVDRGPQGTLFGASSEGGTIHFITNRPDLDTFSGSVRGELSGTGHGGLNYDSQAVVNLPLIDDMLALRGSFEYGDQSGWVDNTNPLTGAKTTGINSERDIVGRLAALWQVTPDLSVTPALFVQRVTTPDTPDFLPSLGVFHMEKSVDEFARDTMFIPSLTVNEALGFGDLTSSSSYFWRQESRQKDGTFFNSAAIAEFFLDPAYPGHQQQNDAILANVPSPVRFHDTWETFTQEIRLTSKPPSDSGLPFKWTVGLFYSDEQNQHHDDEYAPGFGAAFQSIYGYNINNDPILGDGDPNLWAGDKVYVVHDKNDQTQYAGFGQVDIDIMPKLHLGIGGRYLIATESFNEIGSGFFEVGNAGVTAPYNQKAEFYSFTPKYTLTYDVDPDSSVYAVASKGFRLGGATSPNYNTPCLIGLSSIGITNPPSTYQSDELWNYELGTKLLAMNHSLSIDAAGYYIDWQRIQQQIIIPICGGELNYNVGNAEIYGSELQVTYKPDFVPGMTLGLTASGEHAVITSAIANSPAQAGDKVLYTPDFTVTSSIDYAWPVSNDETANVHLDYDFTGRSHGSFQHFTSPGVVNPEFDNPQYGVLNASLGLNFDTYKVMLFGKNLTNNHTIIQQIQINSVNEGYSLQPLTMGLSVVKTF